MAECIIILLIPKLTTLIVYSIKFINYLAKEYELIKELQSDVIYIRDELGSMRSFLRIAEAKQDADVLDDEQKAWFKQVMEVAFDTEDVVDEILLLAQSSDGFIQMFMKSPARRQISSKIRDIKCRVEHISARHQRYKSIDWISDTSSRRISDEQPNRGHALLLREADLVGIDRPKTEIISLILTDESHLKAISVVGMGGLGKTTLVKRVFEDSYVKRAFPIHVWWTISQTFILEDALKNLIHQLIKIKWYREPVAGELGSMDRDGLRAFVNNFLKDDRYIIVLDDLWKFDHWDSIKYVFPDNNCGSRIIITTRIKDVATICCHEFRGNVHTMQQLSTDESWQLFCQRIFRKGGCPPHLLDISRRIMSKCEGLPLGIVEIGRLLALKDTSKPGEWEIVLRSLGGELKGNGKLDRVRKILLLSYNDLPYYLKCCLLYMGMFPEHTVVISSELMFLWMAEGFVEVRHGKTAIEVAENYLNDLIGRSLIHVVETNPEERVVSCRVHGLTYKIILSKCKEYNMLPAAFTPNSVQLENVRRLVVDESTFPNEHAHLLRLRSLILSRKSPTSISDSSLSILLERTSKLLKVLHLKSSNLNIIPNEVFNLSNLTYLNLSKTNVTNIPTSIRKLQNLEFFSLVGTKVTELPADIIILKKLNYLGLGGSGNGIYDYSVSGFKAPNGLGALSSLQFLHYIEADSEEVIREIGKLTQLRNLRITKVTRAHGRELCSSLEKLTNLHLLEIQTKTLDEIVDLEYPLSSTLMFLHCIILTGHLVKLPNWVPSCLGLSKVVLYHSCLRENPLGCLEGMPNLVDLGLLDAYTGDTLNFKAGGFQKLKNLVIANLSGLKLMRFEKGTLPDLETLSIKNCKLIKELPQDIQYLRKLRTLSLEFMPTRLGNSLRSLNKESDGYKKIAHISEIRIGNNVDGKWEVDNLKW